MDTTLEERRLRNIERNQQFLLQLFASQVAPEVDTLATAEDSSKGLDPVYDEEVAVEEWEREIDVIVQDLINEFPERKAQILQLNEYFTLNELVSAKFTAKCSFSRNPN